MHRARHSAGIALIRPRLAIALVVASAGLVTAVWLPSRLDNAAATESERTAVVFSDDFNGDRGSAVDDEKWVLRTGGDGFGADEKQFYTDSTRNARLDGEGNLVITARAESRSRLGCFYGRCEFTSAKLQTKDTLTGTTGRAEARIQVPQSQGVQSLFRLIGTPDDVTVLDNRGDASRQVRAVVGPETETLEAEEPFSDAFHTYSVDWAPGRIVWAVDGREFFRSERTATFDQPFSVLLNLAVGGDVAGDPRDRKRFPQRMVVDFVRVTTEQAAENPPATTAPPAAAPWKPFKNYAPGDRVSFLGRTYEVLLPHTSLPGWEPSVLEALFRQLP
jgi:beta-glucanase (GH16 family)